jgi:hypothetical protein
MGHQDFKLGQQGYKLAGLFEPDKVLACYCLATTVILLAGARQLELWILILTL